MRQFIVAILLVYACGCSDTSPKPSQPEHVKLDRAFMLLKSAKYEKAIDLLKTCSTENPRTLTLLGWGHNAIGEHDAALEFLNESISRDPNEPFAFYNRGYSYLQKHDVKMAINDFSFAIKLCPKYTEAYCNRGIAYGMISDFERALEDFDTAIRLDPQYAESYRNRANVYQALGEQKKADADIAMAEKLKLRPDTIRIYSRDK